MNKIVQSGPAQDRTRAMSGPLSRSMASLATLDRAWATVPPGAQADPRRRRRGERRGPRQRDLAYTVGFERGPASVDGGPEREMVIRVTHIYRRFGEEWMLVHRHADFPPADQHRA
jgi:hypothetical protein